MRSVNCKNCGKEIRVDNKRFESVKNICCSNECRYEFARKNNKNYFKRRKNERDSKNATNIRPNSRK